MRNCQTHREWPYVAKAARDNAAEEIAAALNEAYPLAEIERDTESLRKVTRTIYHLENALRLLESVGAQTKVPELFQFSAGIATEIRGSLEQLKR